MQKILKFLEANVQWVAIGIAALFLGWMIYGYVIQKPITSTVSGAQLTPGEIDQKIEEGPANRLRSAMQGNSAPGISVKDFVTPLKDQLTGPPAPVSLAGPWSGIPLPPNAIDTTPKINVVPNAVLVNALPSVPAPTNLDYSQGRSNVTVPDPAAVASGAAPAAGAGTAADKNWVTVGATIPVKAIAASFAAKNIPVLLSSTTILRVELIRQELDSSNNWGPETPAAPLLNVQLIPLPPANAPIPDQQPYITWAETNQVSLLQPPFYTVLQADPWYAPGTTPPAPTAVAAPPEEPAAVDPAKQKELEAAAKRKALQDAQKAKQTQTRPPVQSRPPAAGGYGGGGGYHPEVIDPGRPVELAQAAVPQPYAPPPYGQMPPQYPPQYPPSNPGAPAAGTPGVAGAIPNPSTFDPRTQADINIWAHDDTIQPGHTYRYKLRYTIANPVRASSGACSDPKLAEIFSIDSDPSDWTAPISVKSETNVYAITTNPGREAVKFEIFRWKNGGWQSQVFDTEPGDVVGGPRGTGDAKVDFSTGLTLVAVKSDPRNPENRIILLTGDNGKLSRHDLNADQNSPDYKKLKEQTTPKPGAPGAPETPTAAARP